MNERALRRIDRGWTVEKVGVDAGPGPVGPIDARVPGVVHHALLDAGFDVDPDAGDGETAQRWVGLSDWIWRRRLDADDLPEGVGSDDVLELEFASIDTVGEIRIDGASVLYVHN